MKNLIRKIANLFLSRKKLVYAAPSITEINTKSKERYAFSDSWCYASESK